MKGNGKNCDPSSASTAGKSLEKKRMRKSFEFLEKLVFIKKFNFKKHFRKAGWIVMVTTWMSNTTRSPVFCQVMWIGRY